MCKKIYDFRFLSNRLIYKVLSEACKINVKIFEKKVQKNLQVKKKVVPLQPV